MSHPILDVYVSEISVSDGHGGGISLQRVLGRDLEGIGQFLHLSRFAMDVPAVDRVRQKSGSVLGPFESDRCQRWLGEDTAIWMQRRTAVVRWQARRAASTLGAISSGPAGLTALVCPQKAVSLRTLEYVKQMRPVRYITWFMDDHLLSWRRGSWTYPAAVRHDMERHLREASTVFVISPALQDFYRREFGVSSQVLCGPADPIDAPIDEVASVDGPLRIGYFGRVWEWQLGEILRFASRLSADQSLHIYSPDTGFHEQLRRPGIELKGALQQDEVLARMHDYDAVLLPIGFGEGQRHLTEFNIATKMSECLASGTVTIVYGPSYAAMVRFLQPTGAAHIITSPDLHNWPAVARAVRDAAERRKILSSARALVQRELSTDVMRNRWRAAVEKLAHPVTEGPVT